MEQGQHDVIMREYCGTCMLYSTVIWSKVSVMLSCVSSSLAQAACSSQPTYWHEALTSSKSHLSSTMICRPTAKTTSIGTLVVVVASVVVLLVVVVVNFTTFVASSFTVHYSDHSVSSLIVPLVYAHKSTFCSASPSFTRKLGIYLTGANFLNYSMVDCCICMIYWREDKRKKLDST